jgi:plasmid stabilization system protein ParE
MADGLPDLYFRIRDSGAVVFRLAETPRTGRLEMEQIATVHLRSGEVRPQGDRGLSESDRAAIADWVAARQALLQRRAADETLRTVEQLNLTAQWAQGRARDAELEAVTDALLLAMHDLRSVLVRRKADRQAAPETPAD